VSKEPGPVHLKKEVKRRADVAEIDTAEIDTILSITTKAA